jgi:hypothetical protein
MDQTSAKKGSNISRGNIKKIFMALQYVDQYLSMQRRLENLSFHCSFAKVLSSQANGFSQQ